MTPVVDAVVVEAVLEAGAECSDRQRARAALSEALLSARAPAHGVNRPHGLRSTPASTSDDAPASPAHWSVTMNVGAAVGGTRSVDAVIVDDAGTVVAERTLTDRSARVCLSLARAVGAWASLVLDAEMNRAKDDDGVEPARSTTTPAPTRPFAQAAAHDDAEKESATTPSHLELGTMVYIRDGLSTTGGVAGLSPFVTVELTPSWVLRPALFFGRSTAAFGETATDSGRALSHLGARTDLCRRIPGNYIDRRGLEADLCSGVEGGVVVPTLGIHKNPARVALGPSVNLRGELGAGVALEVRGLVGVNLLQYASLETPLVFVAAELGVSVRFR